MRNFQTNFKVTCAFLVLLLSSCKKEELPSGEFRARADFPGVTRGAHVGFHINGIIYIGTGYSDAVDPYSVDPYLKDFWAYNPASDSWERKADLPGLPRSRAVAFSIGNKGYVGTGLNNDIDESCGCFPFNYLKDFWEYNPVNDSWTQKKEFPGIARDAAIGFSIGGKGYIGTGINDRLWVDTLYRFIDTTLNDFWEYDPSADTWIRMQDCSCPVWVASGFAINGKGYVGFGQMWDMTSGDFNCDGKFWEYNPMSNSWTKKSTAGLENFGANKVTFTIGDKGYVNFVEYDGNNDTWLEKKSITNSGLGVGASTSAFILKDNSSEFWEFIP